MANAWRKAVWCFLATHNLLNPGLASALVQDVPFKNASFTNETSRSSQPSSASTHLASSGSGNIAGQSTSSTTSQRLGDFIAQGLGISTTTKSLSSDGDNATISSSSSLPPSTLTSHSLSQTTKGSSPGGPQQNASVASEPLTRPASVGTLSQGRSINGSASPTGFIPSEEITTWPNRSLTLSGDCWNQWSQYWSAQDWPVQWWTSNSYTTETFTTTVVPVSMYTSVFLSFYTTTVFGGRFPLTTYSTTAPVSEYEWSTGTPSTTSTGTLTWNPGFSEGEMPSASLPTPLCGLPSSVSQCQKSWDDWVDWSTSGQQAATFRDIFPSGCDPSATTTIPLSCKAPLSTWQAERSSYYARGNPPRCSQAKLDDAYCSQTRSIFLSRGEKKGYYFDDAQYTPTTIDGISTDVMVWPSKSTIAGPGCTLGCGNCALQGQTVELIYWPPATVLLNGTYHTATLSATGPVTFETLGTTLTSPTVYISFDTLWAKNSCSRFGRSISSTIVAITNTQDMSSLYGYGLHMDGRQMSASFNFNDLYQDPVPQEIYESQPRCWLSSRAAQGGRYRPLPSDYPGCARTAPYEPIIVIPAEVRDLDPEWANCKGGIEGVYDPPVALRQTDSIVVPTQPGVQTTTSPAAPASTPTSDSAPQTVPVPVPSPRPTSASKLPDHDPIEGQPSPAPVDPPAKPSSTAKNSDNNVWPLPVTDLGDDDPDPTTTNALSVLKSAQASAAAAQVASEIAAGIAGLHGSGSSGHDDPGQQGGTSQAGQAGSGWPDGTPGADDPGDAGKQEENSQGGNGRPDGTSSAEGSDDPGQQQANGQAGSGRPEGTSDAEDPNDSHTQDGLENSGGSHTDDAHQDGTHATEGTNDPGSHATDSSADSKQAAAVWTHDGESFTAVVGGSSAVIYGAGTATTIAAGTRQTFQGQDISVPLGGNAIKVDGRTLELTPVNGGTSENDPNKQGAMVFNAAGKAFTAIPLGISMVLQADGAATTMAPGAVGVFAGQTISVPPSGSNIVNVNGNLVTMQSLTDDSTTRLSASAFWTHDGETFTAELQGDSTILLIGPNTTVRATAGSSFTLGNEVVSVLPTGNALVHDGNTVTLARPAAPTYPVGVFTTLDHDGEIISAFDYGRSVILVVGDRTMTLADGAQTRFDGELFSAAGTGGAIIVNGTTTLTLPTTTSAATSPTSESGQVTGGSTGTLAASPNNSAAEASFKLTMSMLAFLSIIAITWL